MSLCDVRKGLLDARWNLLAQVKTLEKQIDLLNLLLADLKID